MCRGGLPFDCLLVAMPTKSLLWELALLLMERVLEDRCDAGKNIFTGSTALDTNE